MIYVSKSQIHQVEYLLRQAAQGHHILFDNETIRSVFEEKPAPSEEEEAYSVEHHIEELIALPSLSQQRAYLDQLNQETFKRVVKAYFNIIENSLYENSEATRH